MRRLWSTLRNLAGLRRVERDLDDEIGSYQDLLAREKMSAGMSDADARRAARLESGGNDTVKEAVRDARAGQWAEQVARDVRYAFRSLRRSPGFSVFTLLTFGIAIGGLTIIFSLVNAVLLKPLAYPDSDRLVMVLEVDSANPVGGYPVSAPNYLDWRRQNDVFQGMALFEYLGFNLAGDGEPEAVGGLRVTGGVFDVLRVPPLLGRGLLPSDDAGARVVVLSHRLWKRRFASDSAIIGRSIRVNNEPYEVVGVMPAAFAFPATGTEVWVPIGLNAEDQGRASHSFFAIARLKDGVSVTAARASMMAMGARLAAAYPTTNAGETVNVFPMRDLWVEGTESTLRMLLAAVAIVLLIASANIASLTVARDVARRREIAARLALGGSRRQVVRQLVTESLLIAMAGAALGLILSAAGIKALLTLMPPSLRNVPFRDLSTVSLDPLVVGVALLIAALAGIVAGLVPALAVIPSEPALALRDGGARGGSSRMGQRLKGVLVGIEVGLAVMVLVAAGLLISSIQRVQQVAPGLDVHNVMEWRIELPQKDFYGVAERATFCADVSREVGAVAGVQSASAVSHLPLSGSNAGRSFVIEGSADPGPGNVPGASYAVACPGYFHTLGIPIVAGRDFAPTDIAASPPVVIINERLRARYFPGENPVGRRFKMGSYGSPNNWITIIGVAGDVRHLGLQTPPAPYFWAPYGQAAWPAMNVMVRTAGEPLALTGPVRDAIKRAAPGEPLRDPDTMERVLEASLGHLRFPMVLFTVFAIAALSLAALGCFGVASQSVAQRRRELAVRLALGARATQVYGMVVAQSMRPVVWGLAAGIVGALAGTRLLGQLLYDVKPTDPFVLGAGVVVLATTMILASVLPARSASRVDPAAILREE